MENLQINKPQFVQRCKCVIIDNIPILERWFEIATYIQDQVQYYNRQHFFEQSKKKAEFVANGGDPKKFKCEKLNDTTECGLSIYKTTILKVMGRIGLLPDGIPEEMSEDKYKEIVKECLTFPSVLASKGQRNANSTWSTFLKLLKKYNDDPSSLSGKPGIVRYRYSSKQGKFLKYATVDFCKGSGEFSKINEETREITVGLVKDQENQVTVKIPIDVQFNSVDSLKFIRISKDKVKVSISFKVPKNDLGLNKGTVMGIDYGMKNLMTCVTNGRNGVCLSVIFKGGSLMSIIQYKNKQVAKMQRVLVATGNGSMTSKKIRKLVEKCNNKVKYIMECMSKKLIDICIEQNIGRIIIGENKGWKGDCEKMNVKTRQMFVQIPYKKLTDMISRKAEMVGIEVETKEESYTSIVDHLALEKLGKHKNGVYLGKRKGRHQKEFWSSCCGLINADCNGAIGILRKGDAVTDEELVQMRTRHDIFSPTVVDFMPKQGKFDGEGQGKKRSWTGDKQAARLMKKDTEFVKTILPGIKIENLEIKKMDELGLKNPWVIIDKETETVIDDAQGYGYRKFGSAKAMLDFYEKCELEQFKKIMDF